MIYTLYFRATDGEISLKMFQNYFNNHPHYHVEGPQAFYRHADTGARFSFVYLHTDGGGSKNVRPEGTYRIALNLSYCVPAFFAMEALYEVEKLIDETQVVLYDPQSGGVGNKAFNGEVMFDCWMTHNEEALRQLVLSNTLEEKDYPLVPYDLLQLVWEWNYAKVNMQGIVGDDVQVPVIMALFDGEYVRTGVMWNDGAPIAMPNVDFVVVKQKEQDGQTVYGAVAYEAIEGFVKAYAHIEGAAYVLSYDRVPDDVRAFFAQVTPERKFKRLDMSAILEKDIVEDALNLDGDA